MARMFNVNPDGMEFRLVNCDHIMEIKVWKNTEGLEGTQIRMHAADGKEGGSKPFLITVNTPMNEILRRMQSECLVL